MVQVIATTAPTTRDQPYDGANVIECITRVGIVDIAEGRGPKGEGRGGEGVRGGDMEGAKEGREA